MRIWQISLSAVLVLGGLVAARAETPPVLRLAGSGYTMPRFTEPWAEAFSQSHSVHVEIERDGTSTGPPALLSGRAHIACMTRPMNSAELEAFRARFGKEPLAIPVAADALAVFVNEKNPLKRLTLAQLDAVFSTTRRCGAEKDAKVWGDLGLDGEWSDRTIGLYGRRPGSGTGTYFRNVALCKGQFKDWLRINPGRESAALAIAEARYGIGFGSYVDRRPGMKPLALSRDGETFGTVIPDDVYSGTYPLGRHLYFYVGPQAESLRHPALAEFVRYALSEDAQALVEAAGYLKVPASVANKALASEIFNHSGAR